MALTDTDRMPLKMMEERKLIKVYKGKFRPKHYRMGDKLIRVTHICNDIFLYERYDTNGYRKGMYIVGFRLYSDMIPIKKEEFETEVKDKHNGK